MPCVIIKEKQHLVRCSKHKTLRFQTWDNVKQISTVSPVLGRLADKPTKVLVVKSRRYSRKCKRITCIITLKQYAIREPVCPRIVPLYTVSPQAATSNMVRLPSRIMIKQRLWSERPTQLNWNQRAAEFSSVSAAIRRSITPQFWWATAQTGSEERVSTCS